MGTRLERLANVVVIMAARAVAAVVIHREVALAAAGLPGEEPNPACARIRVAALFTSLAPAIAIAQLPHFDLPRGCESCRIEVSVVVEFQSVWRDGGLSPLPLAVARFATSDWIVVDANTPDIYRFDARGRYISPVGRRGAGPGEFRRPDLAFAYLGDSTAILDQTQGRWSVFDPLGRYARAVRWVGGAPTDVAVRPSGAVVVSAQYATRSSFGLPLHEFAPSGELIRSFGAPTNMRVDDPSSIPILHLPSKPLRDGSLWAIDARAPRLTHWSPTGKLLTEWTLPMQGFAPLRSSVSRVMTGAEFFGIDVDSLGHVWLALGYPDSHQSDALGDEITVDGLKRRRVNDYGRYFDTQMIVLDPSTGRILASRVVDDMVLGSVAPGRFRAIAPGGISGVQRILSVRLVR